MPDGARVDASGFGGDWNEQFFAQWPGSFARLARWIVHEAGKADAHLPPLPVDFIPDEAADRGELGGNGFVVELPGVQARYEHGGAELMARKMHGHAGDARQAMAAEEGGGGRAHASQGHREFPVFSQANHPLHPDQWRRRWHNRHQAPPSVGAATQRG